MAHHRTRLYGSGLGSFFNRNGERMRLMDEHKRHKRKGKARPGCPWCTTSAGPSGDPAIAIDAGLSGRDESDRRPR